MVCQFQVSGMERVGSLQSDAVTINVPHVRFLLWHAKTPTEQSFQCEEWENETEKDQSKSNRNDLSN